MKSSNFNPTFFNENILKRNKSFQYLLYVSFLVPIIIFAASKIAGYEISFFYFVLLSCFVIFANLIEILLNRNPRLQNFSMYFGLTSLTILIGIMGAAGIVPIYLSYIFIPVLSTLYLKKSVMNYISALGFIVMLVSFWFRSFSIMRADPISGIAYPHKTVFLWNGIGLSFEYIFSYFVCFCLTKRSISMIKNLSEALETKTALLEQLETSTEALLVAKDKEDLHNRQLHTNQLKIIEFVAEVIASHDLFIGEHISHTRSYVVIIAEELKKEGLYTDVLTDETIQLYSTAAFLHDIGKIHVPDEILNKTGKYTPEEFEIMKSHPEEGLKLLNYLPVIDDNQFNEIAKEMAYYHHEKWDGTGYPNHLAGNEIPLSARIMAAADVLDALISQRHYKLPMSIDQAMQVFEESKGSHFEPCIANAVIKSRDKIEYTNEEFKRKESKENREGLEWYKFYDADEDISEDAQL